MKYRIVMLPEAKDDLVNLYEYVATHDSIVKADVLLDKLEEQCQTLKTNPERGHPVVELSRIYAEGFKEVHFKPYIIMYQKTRAKGFHSYHTRRKKSAPGASRRTAPDVQIIPFSNKLTNNL